MGPFELADAVGVDVGLFIGEGIYNFGQIIQNKQCVSCKNY